MAVPIVDLATLIVTIVAVAYAPLLVARFERRSAFDRGALSGHLAPAREELLRIEDALRMLQSDQLTDDERQDFVVRFRSIRTNIRRANDIALRWKWSKPFTDELESAAGYATQLNRLVTGGKPFSELAVANELTRALDNTLLELLRSCAS